MFHIEISYERHSGYFAHGGPTLETATAHLAKMIALYGPYWITEAIITEQCNQCEQGAVLRCRHIRKVSHSAKCYKACPTCHGEYRRIIHTASPEEIYASTIPTM